MEVWSGQAMPLALSEEEETQILGRLGTEEEGAAREAMIVGNVRLVAWIVSQSFSGYREPEELMAEGILGLVKGVQSFDPEKSDQISRYVGTCIRNEIRMYLRREQRRSRRYSRLSSDQEEDLSAWEELRSAETQEELRRLRDALGDLPERDRLMLTLRYGLDGTEPQTQAETAHHIGVSQSYLSRWERKLLKRLRQILER